MKDLDLLLLETKPFVSEKTYGFNSLLVRFINSNSTNLGRIEANILCCERFRINSTIEYKFYTCCIDRLKQLKSLISQA